MYDMFFGADMICITCHKHIKNEGFKYYKHHRCCISHKYVVRSSMNESLVTTEEPTKLPLWKNLAEVVMQWEYGSEHLHEEIENILGIPRMVDKVYPNEEYYDAITNANAYITPLGKRLENMYSLGYRVLSPDDYPKHIRTIYTKSLECMRHGITISSHAPRHLMSDSKREFLDRQQVTHTRLLLNNADTLEKLYSNKNTTKNTAQKIGE